MTRVAGKVAVAASTVGLALAVGACQPTPVESGQHRPFYGDLNADGHTDRVTLVAADGDGPCLADVEVRRASGGFEPAERVDYQPPPDEAGHCPDMGTIVDIGGDGQPNLVLAWWDGAFSAPYDVAVYGADFTFVEGFDVPIAQPLRIGHADFNGDGLEDVYEVTDQGLGLQSYLNTPAGDLTPGPVQHEDDSLPTYRLADFDGDGGADLAVAYTVTYGDVPPEGVAVVLDDGTRVQLLEQRASDLEADDLDGDGHKDVRATLSGTGEVVTFRGNGDGTFTPA